MKTKILFTLAAFSLLFNVSFAQLNFSVAPGSLTLTPNPTAIASGPNAGTTINVFSVAGLQVGMTVFITTGTATGVFPSGTTITAIGATSFTSSLAPTTPLVNGALIVTNLLINQGRDDYGSPETPLGFNFQFGARTYNSFVANCDGFVILGNATSMVASGAANLAGTSTITVTSGANNLVVGQRVYVASGVGSLGSTNTVATLISPTQFTVTIPITTTIAATAVIRATSLGDRLCAVPGATATSPGASGAGAPPGPIATYVLPTQVAVANGGPINMVGPTNPPATGNCDNNGGGTGVWYINNMTTTTYLPMIAPLWDDLVTNSTNGRVSFRNMTGPNRLVIEFFNMARWPSYSVTAFTFQLILYQTTNKIEMVYHVEGTNTQSIASTIGMRSLCAGDQYFLNKNNPIDNLANPSRTLETTTNTYPASNTVGADVSYIWTTSSTPSGGNDKLCDLGVCRATPLPIGAGICNPFSSTIAGSTNSSALGDATYNNPLTCPGPASLTQDNDVWFSVDVPAIASRLSNLVSGNNTITIPGGTAGLVIGMPVFHGFLTTYPTTITGIPTGTTITVSTAPIGTVAGTLLNFGSVISVSTDNVPVTTCATSGVGFQVFKSLLATGSPLTTCPAALGNPVRCSDNNGILDPANSSETNIYVQAGFRYFIRVEGDAALTPNFSICVYDKLNDGICDAINLIPAATCNPILYTTVGATASIMYNLGVGLLDERAGRMQQISNNTDPAFTASVKDVWFKFTVPNVVGGSRDWVIEAFAGTLLDGCMAIYERTDDQGAFTIASGLGPNCTNPLLPLGRMGTSSSTFTNFASQNDNKTGTSDLMSRIVAVNLTYGKTYYVRFWGNIGPALNGTFSICVYERPTCGVIVDATTCPDIYTVAWSNNPNGNYNGTKCSTPLPALPNDTNGRCYTTYPKIPTIGTGFTPLCGDNFNAAKVTLAAPPKYNPPDLNAAFLGLTSSGFCSTLAGAPANNTLANPIYYRIKIAAAGDLKMELSNQICALGLGMRSALYKVNTTAVNNNISPPLPPPAGSPGGYDCSVITQWTAINTKALGIVNQNTLQTPVTGARYCNSATAPTNTGATNPGKYSMTWTMAAADVGNIYYLVMDGVTTNAINTVPTQLQQDRCYFDMALTGAPVVLPIRLLSLKGRNTEGTNILNWITSSEENNDYFVLERSKNGDDFEDLAKRDGAGTSSVLHNYEVIDANPYSGLNFYRVRMVDFAGVTTYTDMISVYSSTGKMIDFNGVRPNPATSSVFTDFYIQQNANLSIDVRDVSGKLVKTFNSTVASGSNSLETDISDIENGLYFITIRDIKSGEAYTQRFVKQ